MGCHDDPQYQQHTAKEWRDCEQLTHDSVEPTMRDSEYVSVCEWVCEWVVWASMWVSEWVCECVCEWVRVCEWVWVYVSTWTSRTVNTEWLWLLSWFNWVSATRRLLCPCQTSSKACSPPPLWPVNIFWQRLEISCILQVPTTVSLQLHVAQRFSGGLQHLI